MHRPAHGRMMGMPADATTAERQPLGPMAPPSPDTPATGTGGLLQRLRARYSETARTAPRLKGWRAYANLARGYSEYLRGTASVRARPVKLVFDVTNACQLGCLLCPTGNGMAERRTGHADEELFRKLMDQVGDDVFMVDFFNWGEPLLNPRIDTLIAMARARGIVSTISTNLSLRLSDERIDRIITSGIGEISVSLDGASAATHQHYRRKSDFDLICANMRRLAAARKRLGRSTPLLSWQFIVFRFNEHEIERARTMAADFGFDRINVRPPFLDTDRYDLTDEERAEIAQWAPVNPQYATHVSGAPMRSRCGWHYTTTTLNWDGTVSPCCTTFKESDDFGSLGRHGEYALADVVNNDAFRTARAHIANPALPGGDVVCARCPSPSIMDYHRHVYRRIAMLTGVAVIEAIRRGFRRLFGRPPATA